MFLSSYIIYTERGDHLPSLSYIVLLFFIPSIISSQFPVFTWHTKTHLVPIDRWGTCSLGVAVVWILLCSMVFTGCLYAWPHPAFPTARPLSWLPHLFPAIWAVIYSDSCDQNSKVWCKVLYLVLLLQATSLNGYSSHNLPFTKLISPQCRSVTSVHYTLFTFILFFLQESEFHTYSG